MKVVHYCRSFSKLSQTFIYDYVTELERQGIENIVVTEKKLNSHNRPFNSVKIIDKPGLLDPERLLRRIGTELRGDHPKIARWEILRRRLSRVVGKINPDVFHAHFGPEGAKIAPVVKKLGAPLVTSFYGYDISRLMLDDFWISQYQQLNHRVDAVTALSQQMKSRLCKIVQADKISVIHLSRNLTEFNFRLPSPPVRKFISVGRLTGKKGHFDTIEAFSGAVKCGYKIKLDIIGGGKLKEELKEHIKRFGVEDSVKLLGALSNRQVVARMAKADAFILCSKTGPNGDMEGTPTVLVEAQAMGLPCISTRHAGIPEMIPQENQRLLAEEGNVDQIKDKIRKLVSLSENEIRQISEKGRSMIEQNFNLKNEAQKLIRLYKKVNKN